jgi:hypothetical protein
MGIKQDYNVYLFLLIVYGVKKWRKKSLFLRKGILNVFAVDVDGKLAKYGNEKKWNR